MQHGLQDETFDIIYIPELKVTLPLHLGANDENMANGAAVLGQTSVPVGGVNTNSVIAGHRGWNRQQKSMCLSRDILNKDTLIGLRSSPYTLTILRLPMATMMPCSASVN